MDAIILLHFFDSKEIIIPDNLIVKNLTPVNVKTSKNNDSISKLYFILLS